MSRSEALKNAAAALAGAAQYEDAAAGVVVGEPTSPSGADDAATLADADRTARMTAADGRVFDVLVELRQHYPGAFAKLAALPAEGGTVATPPVVPPKGPPASEAEPPSPLNSAPNALPGVTDPAAPVATPPSEPVVVPAEPAPEVDPATVG